MVSKLRPRIVLITSITLDLDLFTADLQVIKAFSHLLKLNHTVRANLLSLGAVILHVDKELRDAVYLVTHNDIAQVFVCRLD